LTFTSKFTKMRLAAGLRPELLSELCAPLARFKRRG